MPNPALRRNVTGRIERGEATAIVEIPAPHVLNEIAVKRYEAGEKLGVSTGIHGGLTFGYGMLDDNGFWQYPLSKHQLREDDPLRGVED